MRTVFFTFLILSLLACSKSSSVPVGIESLKEAQAVADNLFLRASSDKFRQSMDSSNVPREKAEQFDKFVSGWSKARLRNFHKWTKVLTPDEFKQYQAEENKTKSEWLREGELLRKWNYQPETYFVYFFEDTDSKERFSIALTLGLVQRNGLWFFVANF